MHVTGMLRVKNEARWIGSCIASIQPLCEEILVFNDNSTDDTVARANWFRKVVIVPSPFTGTDEARDKNFLLDVCEGLNPDWIIAIDGDEELTEPEALKEAMLRTPYRSLSLPVHYLWDRKDQMRVDGVYGNFRRESVFRPDGSRFHFRGGANFHCGNVPPAIRQASRGFAESPLLHYGYMLQADRDRKYAWYNRNDPNNVTEDRYRHMVIGDVFPAESVFKHGGPLKLVNR